MACELTAWMAMLALNGPARAWEPNACGCACSPQPDAWPAAAAGRAAARRHLALGHPDHHRHHPPAGPGTRLTSQNRPDCEGRRSAGPWNPAHPARQPGHCPWPDAKISDQP